MTVPILQCSSEHHMANPGKGLITWHFISTWEIWATYYLCKMVELGTALVSCSWCNWLPQTRWLKRTDICYLIVLEARGLKSRFQRLHFYKRFWGTFHSLPFSASEAPGVLWLVVTSFQSPWLRSHCCLFFCLSHLPLPSSHKDTCHWIWDPPRWPKMLFSSKDL